MKLSVLDLVPVIEGGTVSRALSSIVPPAVRIPRPGSVRGAMISGDGLSKSSELFGGSVAARTALLPSSAFSWTHA